MMNEIQKIIKKYKDIPLEFFGGNHSSISSEMMSDKLSSADMSVTKGIGVKAIVSGKVGFAYTTDISCLEHTVENAIKNAKYSELAQEGFCEKQELKKVSKVYDLNIHKMGAEDLVAFSLQLREKLKAIDKKINVNHSVFGAGSSESFLVNSNGVSYTSKDTEISGFVEAVYNKNSGSSDFGSTSISGFNLDFIVNRAFQLAKSSDGMKQIKTSTQQVVLDSDVLESILGHTFYPALNGDRVQKGLSSLEDKVGKNIGCEGLSLVDSGIVSGGLCSSSFDRDGSLSQETKIISGGVLKSFIYDYVTAKRVGKKSTGNGVGGFCSMTSISPTNIVLDFSDKVKYDNMISGIKDGVIIYDAMGAHTANPVTGDFSLSIAKGFKIINGEIAYPIKNAMFAGNVFELLKNVSCIGDDVRQSGHLISPTVTFDKQKIVG